MHKPVLFPCVISACVGLADLGGENPHNIHKQEEVQLRKKEQREITVKGDTCCLPNYYLSN